jgi:hypothetical protein
MVDRSIKVSQDTWEQLKLNACYNGSSIKTIITDMVNGKRDPQTGKPI